MQKSDRAIDAQLRRAASKLGLCLQKSRWRLETDDNHGMYRINDARTGNVRGGLKFNLHPYEIAKTLASAAEARGLLGLAASMNEIKDGLEDAFAAVRAQREDTAKFRRENPPGRGVEIALEQFRKAHGLTA